MVYNLSESASIWISNKIVSEIFGICCDISNDISLSDLRIDKRCKFEETKGYLKLIFLVENFCQFVDMGIVIDTYLSKKFKTDAGSQWRTEYHKIEFKSYVNKAILEVRNKKIETII